MIAALAKAADTAAVSLFLRLLPTLIPNLSIQPIWLSHHVADAGL
jgi:hypothetical protein